MQIQAPEFKIMQPRRPNSNYFPHKNQKENLLYISDDSPQNTTDCTSSTSSLTYLNHLAQYCYQPDHQKPLQPISHQSPLYTTQQIPPDLFTITMP